MTLAILILALAFPLLGAPQRRPDFSGTWAHEASFVTGASRSGESDEPRPTPVHTSSGAGFNCGKECTITQKGQRLTVDSAHLADYKGKDPSQRTPAVTFNLDGRQVSVVDSFSPPRQLAVTAKWEGTTLLIETNDGGRATTQRLALEGGQLVVRTATVLNGEPRAQLTMKYRKK